MVVIIQLIYSFFNALRVYDNKITSLRIDSSSSVVLVLYTYMKVLGLRQNLMVQLKYFDTGI